MEISCLGRKCNLWGKGGGNTTNFIWYSLSFSRRAHGMLLFTPKHLKYQMFCEICSNPNNLCKYCFLCFGVESWSLCARRENDSKYHMKFMVFSPRSPPKMHFLPKPQIPTISGEFTEIHLKWVEFGEKYRSGREKHLKRPKMDCVFIVLRVKARFPPPNHQKSPKFT